MRVRTHGTSGPLVIALHGGPGAPGSIAPVARGLADAFTVLEPWQRSSAAAHPDAADPLALIGCGTFDTAARARQHPARRLPAPAAGPHSSHRSNGLESPSSPSP